MIEAFRIARAEFARELWSGVGGLHVDGRWHSTGRRVIYTAQSLSLAQLELLVHITDRRQMPPLVYASVLIPDEVRVGSVAPDELPAAWRQFSPYSATTQLIGTRWLAEAKSAVLKVPSAISEQEWNYLLNPVHPDFEQLRLAAPVPFAMGPRVPGVP
ncbi:MAG TPA: RES family NAD+ phosphorylase [Steroidobacteraceae bacterium]|nr:RES family NAD+ phosphorylase [Steroidobacteraceae bacterium]